MIPDKNLWGLFKFYNEVSKPIGFQLIEDIYKDGLLDQKVIIDGRGFLDKKIFKNNYFSVGSSKNS